MSKGIVYIAGPMRGLPGLNKSAFEAAECKLKAEGYAVFNPGRLPDGLASSKAYILIDLAALSECTAIYLLRDWERSKGAQLEYAMAEFLELDILTEADDECVGCVHNMGIAVDCGAPSFMSCPHFNEVG